jgi:hypothetical protein
MTSEDENNEEKKSELLEEICENTRAIRRVTNRILDHMHEYQSFYREPVNDYSDHDEISWDDLDNNDDMYM